MKCKNCNTNLSFIPHPVTITTEHGKYETQQVKLAVSTPMYVQLTVICYKCKAVHDVKYGFEGLVQAYTEDERCLYMDETDLGPNDEEAEGEEVYWGELPLQHVNTGCLYEKDGQKITIVFDYDNNMAHFIDHSRMVSGTVRTEKELTAMRVIKRYVWNDYTHIQLKPEKVRSYDIYHKTVEFQDISDDYKLMMQRG